MKSEMVCEMVLSGTDSDVTFGTAVANDNYF